MNLPYDNKNKEDIIRYAKKLEGYTLKMYCKLDGRKEIKGKGSFGQFIERYYFLYEPNSNPEPDFKEAGLELKCSPLKVIKKNQLVAKERMVLNIIDYNSIVQETFYNSSFIKKNKQLLVVFYQHIDGKDILDLPIKYVGKWDFPEEDLEQIKKDWHTIQNKVIGGKAHEISEGDTFYLGACTKGANSQSLKGQPNNSIKAKQRAFSLKQGYVNYIIGSISGNVSGKNRSGSIINRKGDDLQQSVLNRFSKYYNKSIDEIELELNVKPNRKSKSYYSIISKYILGVGESDQIQEFQKAEVVFRTIRLGKNNNPKEEISFPAFKYKELVIESWEESKLLNLLNKKYFFVFFKHNGDQIILDKVIFWNMPYDTLLEAKRVWNHTISILKSGNIIKKIKNQKRFSNFPDKTFSKVLHVRPHARNSQDVYELPISDKLSGNHSFTKHSFWLNKEYVKAIYLNAK